MVRINSEQYTNYVIKQNSYLTVIIVERLSRLLEIGDRKRWKKSTKPAGSRFSGDDGQRKINTYVFNRTKASIL